MTGIEQARIDLAKWDARLDEDKAALAVAERTLEHCRKMLENSNRTAASLRDVVTRWEAMMARRDQPN